MTSKFFTNKGMNSLLNKFNGIFDHNLLIQQFHCITGFFSVQGYINIRPKLIKLKQVKILIGIDINKIVKSNMALNKLYNDNRELIINEYKENVHKEINDADYSKEIDESIKLFLDDIKNKKIEVKIHKDKNLHAKVYIFLPDEFNQHSSGSVITGSSNFTDMGIRSTNFSNRYEFNVELRDYVDVSFAEDEFKKLWEHGEDINIEDLISIKNETYLNDQITPFQLYIKCLLEYFDNIEYDPDSIGDVPQGFKKLKYQVDAINAAYKILMDYNGCFLADVVGLGKTVIATSIVNKLSLMNGRMKTRILVIHPPALLDNWRETIKSFNVPNVYYKSLGSLEHILDIGHKDHYYDKEDYSIIIIDEAHKLRNSKSNMYTMLQQITKSPIKDKGKIINQKKVLLLSATPFNNSPQDILNQILLFTDKNNSILPIKNLESYFTPKIVEYKKIINKMSNEEKKYTINDSDNNRLLELMTQIREDIIRFITVRRTRMDLAKTPMYAEDLKNENIIFPKIGNPIVFEYQMEGNTLSLFNETIDIIEKKLTYARYTIFTSLNDEVKVGIYADTKLNLAAENLAGLMSVRLVKTLESSFYAFTNSLSKILRSLETMLEMIKQNIVYITPNGVINQWVQDYDLDWDQIEELFKKKNGKDGWHKFLVDKDFNPQLLKQSIADLHKDKVILEQLVIRWKEITFDPKLDKLINELPNIINNKNNISGKLVIFSESEITCKYLQEKLKKSYKVLNVSSENIKYSFKDIQANFDANYTQEQKDDISILISTDVLAEGVNLHRSNIIINYDIPWNSTRLMQRIGRINRIGIKADTIYNYSFFPSLQGDNLIKLIRKAHTKLQAFHYTYGEDYKILSNKEDLIEAMLHDPTQSEEQNEELYYLQFIRNLQQKDKHLVDSIKKLSIKSRVIRKGENKSVVFLKIDGRCEFYLCENNRATVLNFIEAIKIIEANINEMGLTYIPQFHYTDVNLAIKKFDDYVIESKQQDDVLQSRNKNINQVKKQLRDINKTNDDNLKNACDKLMLLLDRGVYSNLHKEIKKNLHNHKELIKLSQKYQVDTTLVNQPINIVEPKIILSETFIKG